MDVGFGAITVTVTGLFRIVWVKYLVVVIHWLTVLMDVDGLGVTVVIVDSVLAEAASVSVPVVQRLVDVSCRIVDVVVLVSVPVCVTLSVSVV